MQKYHHYFFCLLWVTSWSGAVLDVKTTFIDLFIIDGISLSSGLPPSLDQGQTVCQPPGKTSCFPPTLQEVMLMYGPASRSHGWEWHWNRGLMIITYINVHWLTAINTFCSLRWCCQMSATCCVTTFVTAPLEKSWCDYRINSVVCKCDSYVSLLNIFAVVC